jgi:non-homologous end joining protein Ku
MKLMLLKKLLNNLNEKYRLNRINKLYNKKLNLMVEMKKSGKKDRKTQKN